MADDILTDLSGGVKVKMPAKFSTTATTAGEKFKLVERRHPEWESGFAEWNFFHQSFIGGKLYLQNESNLFPHLYEGGELHKDRLSRVNYYNYCAPVVNTLVNFIYSQPIDRKINLNFFDDWQLRVSTLDMDFDVFMRNCCTMSAVFGMIGILVDMPAAETREDDGIRTRVADQGKLPILKIYYPTQICDWSETNGYLNWVLLKDTLRIDFNPHEEAEENSIYTLWDATQWQKYDEDNNLIASGVHGLGFVPFERLYNVDVDLNRSGESTLKDIAYINRSIYNYRSLLDEILFRQAFSQLVVEADDPAEYSNRVMSTAYAFNYKVGTKPPMFISPDASQAGLVEASIDKAIQEIYRIASLRLIGEKFEDRRQKTATETLQDFGETNSALHNKAKVMRRFEERILKTAAAWMQEKADTGKIEIRYPAAFDVASLRNEITDAIEMLQLNMGKAFYDGIRTKIIKKKFPGISESELRIMQEGFENITPSSASDQMKEPVAAAATEENNDENEDDD